MPTAEWYEQQARKIKLKTWPESERFTKLDRLNLTLTDKLSKIKPELIQYATDPVKQYSLSARDKQTLAMLRKYAPSLFKKVEQPQFAKTPTQTAMAQAQTKAVQGEVYGAVEEGAYDKLVKYGIIPEMRNKTWWERQKAGMAYPWSKIMSIMMAFPRAKSAMETEQARQMGIEEARKIGFLYRMQHPLPEKKTASFKEFLLTPKFEEPAKAPTSYGKIFKVGAEAFINLKGSEYQDWSSAKKRKELMPESAEPFAGMKRAQENERRWQEIQVLYDKGSITAEEKGNRELALFREYGYRPTMAVKALGAIAGSPADIKGLFLDIATDPLTYISGGATKGFKIADTSFDLIGAGGKKLVPKGSTVVFTKAGNELLQDSMEKFLPKIIKTFADDIAGIGTDIGKNAFINRKVAELALKNSAKNWTTETMSKFIDLGGLKYMGQTVIPGYKFQQKFGKSLEKVAEMKFLKPINKVFNPYYGIPEALRPTKAYSESLARTIYGKDMAEIMGAVTPLGSAERKTLNTLMIAERDITKLTNKLDDITIKIQDDIARTGTSKFRGTATGYEHQIDKLDDIIKNLDITPKVAEAKPKISAILENMFQREAKYIDYDKLQKYFPSIVKKEKFPVKSSVLSAEEAFFQKPQTQDLIKMMRKGVEPEDLITALSKRAKAGALRIGRAENLESLKQFGSKTWAEGLDELVDNSGKVIKELKGWYFPAEYKKTFARVYQTFFGDDAVNQIFKVHDRILTVWKRWALATPGYHARNFWSDMWSGWMEYGADFFNPRRWQMALEANVLRRPIKIANQIYSPDDLAKVGITTGTQYATEGMVRQGLFASNIEKGSPAYWSVKFGNVREGMGRTVAGIIELEKGGTLIDSAFNVKKVFYDYMALTPAEMNIGKRVWPFYTWLRKNIQRQAELLFTRTGRYATTAKASKYLENVAETRFGKEYMEEYKRNIPDYYKDLGAIITAMTNKQGQPLVLNPNLPFQDWSRMNPNDLATSMSPFLKIPIELITNKDLFFKTIIDRAREGQGNYREAPKWLSVIASPIPNDILKYMGMEKANDKVFMTDLTSYFIRQIPPLYVMQRILPAEQTPKTPLDWLSIGAGIKFFNFDIEKEKKDRLNEFIKEVNTELGRQRQLGEEIPDTSQIERAYKQIYVNYLKTQYPKYAVAQSIREKIKYAGGSTKEINLMIDLMEKPYNDAMDKIKDKSLAELAAMLSDLGIKPTMEEINNIIGQLNTANQ